MIKDSTRKLHEIGPEIASHLPGWNFHQPEEANYPTIYLIQPGAERIGTTFHKAIAIHAGWASSGDKLEVSGCWPRGKDRGRGQHLYMPREGDRPRIGMSFKPPQKIAQDIERRFLQEYLEKWEKCEFERQEWNRREAGMDAALEALKNVPLDKAAEAQWNTASHLDRVAWAYFERGSRVEVRVKVDTPTTYSVTIGSVSITELDALVGVFR